jgi:DNA helicase-2/ATP-dependent DNA helicase PcrA
MALGQLADDPNPQGLTLSTVHTMKGLEKDIVFLISMCEGVFPDYRASTKKDIEEERNSAFVAVTRARRWIYITFPGQRKMPWGDYRNQAPSRFLTEMNS